MIMIVFAFIRAERLGDIELQLQATRSMIPFFLASGHHQYLKGARLSLQLFDTWKEKYPQLIVEFFHDGLHTVRYSSRNWSGTWPDMSIEESIMRHSKSSGGLTHGTMRNFETSLKTWFAFSQCTSSVSGEVERLIDFLTRSRGPSAPYAHPDTKKSARSRDTGVVKEITQLATDWAPFDSARDPEELVSLSTGLVDKVGACNPEKARELGEAFLPEMDNKPYLTTIQRSNKVTTLASLKPSVRVGTTTIGQDQINPLRLFHRLILIGSRESSVEDCLEYELTPHPMSLFDTNGYMRPRNKSTFGALLKGRLEVVGNNQWHNSTILLSTSSMEDVSFGKLIGM